MIANGTSGGQTFVVDRVSVIVPARNAAAWIGDAMRSIAAQEHRALEVLVIDDGSTDDTVAIAATFSGALDLHVIRETGRGPSAARNRGLDAATGEFVQFLDADDLLEPRKIRGQLAIARATGADVVWGPFERVFDEGAGLAAARRETVSPAIGDDTAADLISGDGFVQLGALLVRRSGALGRIRMPEHMRVIEDVRYQFALIDAGARYVKQPELSGFVMREHGSPERASRQSSREFWMSCVANARDREALWRGADSLSPARARVLASVYVNAARELAVVSPADSRAVARRAAALYDRFDEFLSPRLRLLTRVFGLQQVEAAAAVGRSIRRALRGE